MNDALRTIDDYELFLYSLPERFPSIRQSTLVLARRGTSLARVAGELSFGHGFRLVVRERLVYDRLPVVIDSYGYEIWLLGEKQFWYDSQPHPDEPSLQATHPHHKHVPPNMKHNRVPAEDLSFQRPNLPIGVGLESSSSAVAVHAGVKSLDKLNGAAALARGVAPDGPAAGVHVERGGGFAGTEWALADWRRQSWCLDFLVSLAMWRASKSWRQLAFCRTWVS